ncbi:tRNA wybutosine-synthesizing protein 1 [Sporothrix schenckii 1099-18]|uniref:tRNA 4-demethylwyosine synthase (AdoMet-dependent) n=1 Tax=Sporothrix schenckii 1099-18 TaxID=1397361 RepID=A0A0F2MI88_SPOSC|nr:tRNA wybutosine-synthesizing protein 1 [Sporothrix schenckii 1099-18]KJR88774.1 tRNA wybutosine-synthesizing protein 1 [Sporothrix schenckii 1099-18]
MASTSRASSPFIRDLLIVVVDAWHAYRIPILLATFAALVSLRIYLHVAGSGDDREGLLIFPKIYDNTTVVDEKKKLQQQEQPPSVQEDVKIAVLQQTKTISYPGSTSDKKTITPTATKKSSTAKTANATTPSSTTTKAAAGPRRIKGELPKGNGAAAVARVPTRIQTIVFYSSITGATAKIVRDYATELSTTLGELKPEGGSDSKGNVFAPVEVLDIAEVDLDEYFISPPKDASDAASGRTTDYLYLFLLPSYNIDSINDTFLEHLKETHHDFRIDTAPLAPLLGYSVFGFGDREGWPTEDEGFCFQAKEVDKWMAKLTGRKRAFPMGVGNTKTDAMLRLAEWSEGVVDVLGLVARTGSLGTGVRGSGDAVETDDEDEDEASDDGSDAYDDGSNDDDGAADANGAAYDNDDVLFGGNAARNANVKRLKKAGVIDDVEDLGRLLRSSKEDDAVDDTAVDDVAEVPGTNVNKAPIAIDFTTYGANDSSTTNGGPRRTGRKAAAPAPKEMVAKDTPTYKSLTKQGYAIVGSHSGVKICRWTKSALRGRGSCYKYSFYGINSHQCMETTPSLSCSNKCVFCWRHGTNPVGTTWRWVVDPPDLIFDGVKANHYQKIKMMRGVPGVRAERFAEAMRIRHCALSLVGEPIFYPHINEFLGMLHSENISSFLVCNAQHPDQLAALHHVTQLYVSIDASNRETLRKIDRPLHRDFWERFQRCLAILREVRFRQRTVFRLTLVKGFNIDDEVQGYADLVEQALPCFVEVKGVTFCGTSTSAGVGLTMANVPFYDEVCEFVTALEKELQSRGLAYGLAAEHAHSCCVLLASERFKRDGKWHTVIDYDKFFALLREKGPQGDFAPEDYMGPPTAEWATWGRGGFDPRDQRVDRKGRPIER